MSLLSASGSSMNPAPLTPMNPEARQAFVLPDGYAVEKAFFDRLLLQVRMAIPTLCPELAYTAQALCGHVITRCVVPSRHSVLSLSSTWPAALS